MRNKILMYVALGVTALILILISPVFSVSEFEMRGNDRLSDAEILEITGYKKSQNIFFVSKGQAKENLMKNPYVQDAKIEKDLLKRKVYIILSERKVSGYVEYSSNNYLYIDKEGRILEIKSSFTDRLPVIVGMKINDGFVLGETLNVENKRVFEILVNLTGLFEKYEIDQDIIRVDLSNENEIHFFYDNIDVILGENNELDLKVRTVKAIIPQLEDYRISGGRLYLEDPRSSPVFLPNT